MRNSDFREAALFENRFWLQIFGDHSRFIHNALSPNQLEEIKKAKYFIEVFDRLLRIAHEISSEKEIEELIIASKKATLELRLFKLDILSNQLIGKIEIALPPTFFNHMLNELEEYLLVLELLKKGQNTLISPLHLHIQWLSDGTGHADSILTNLDMTEKLLRMKSKEFSKVFKNMYLRSIEYKGFTRTGVHEFPALLRLNLEAEHEMDRFKEFLLELRDGIISKKVLGTIYPLMPDHMYREECYYLTKLAQVSNIKMPDCDPTKKRVNA